MNITESILPFSSLFSHQRLQMGYIERTNDGYAKTNHGRKYRKTQIILLLVLTLALESTGSCSTGAQVFAKQIR